MLTKEKCRTLTYSAIQHGLLQRKPCEVCGEEKVEAHHTNYQKPLTVMWLCRKHHKQWHKENGIVEGDSNGKYKNVRVWDETHAKITSIAKKNGRTFNSELAITYGVKIK